MGVQEDGIIGEQKLFIFLKNRGHKFFQPDAISRCKKRYFIWEVKYQERFIPPPFEGHGLPKWQIDARIEFYMTTGIRCMFIVFEKGTENVFLQWLDILEENKYFDTQGRHPRRIYKLQNFKKTKL